MSKIFMSYRRTDSEDAAGRLYDALEEAFGKGNIFKDVYSIPLGVDFRPALRRAVAECQLMLVIIGKQWLTVTDEQGRRRLDNPGDFVRIEVEEALAREIPVIPVLIQGVGMPRASDLPQSLADLAYRNGFTLRGDPYFRPDVGMLTTRMTELLNRPKPEPAGTPAVDRNPQIPQNPLRRKVSAGSQLPAQQPASSKQLLKLTIEDLYTVAQLNPNDVGVWVLLAKALTEVGRCEEALMTADRAIALARHPDWNMKPDSIMLHVMNNDRDDAILAKASALDCLGRSEEARKLRSDVPHRQRTFFVGDSKSDT